MASTDVNAPQFPVLTRGRAVNLGALSAAASVVRFSIAQENAGPNGLECLTITTDQGGTSPAVTAALEASIDGGVTWFTVNPRAAAGTAPNYTAAALNSDTAVTSANSYDVSSLQAGAIFRFGGRTAGTPNVWALYA